PSSVPPPVDHEVAGYMDRSANPLSPLVPLLRLHAPQTDDELAKAMVGLADAITDHGRERWARLLAWEHRILPDGIRLERSERGDDEEVEKPKGPAISLDEERLRREEATAGRYAE